MRLGSSNLSFSINPENKQHVRSRWEGYLHCHHPEVAGTGGRSPAAGGCAIELQKSWKEHRIDDAHTFQSLNRDYQPPFHVFPAVQEHPAPPSAVVSTFSGGCHFSGDDSNFQVVVSSVFPVRAR